jgi:hypothetical protein
MDDKAVEASATLWVSNLLNAGLIKLLVHRGLISLEDAREIFDQALLAIEVHAGPLTGDQQRIADRARQLLENFLEATASQTRK